MGYKFLEHTADIKIQAEGKNLEDAFKQSALALKEAICEKIKVKPAVRKTIKVSGKDRESLLYNFLEEFLYLLDAEGFLLSKIDRIEIKELKSIGNKQLKAEISGDKAGKYHFTNNVKAVTYNEMMVKKIGEGGKVKYVIEFVIDV